jgi:adenylyltransferase/sulfurtransferase
MEDGTKRKKIKLKSNSKEWDSTFQLMSWWKSETVQAAKVMVVGAGALGNEVLKNLALMGVGNIIIVDFDKIEYHNLSRSVLFRESDVQLNKYKVEVAGERIQEINPNIKVKAINGDITIDVGLGVYRRMDAIIGCLDNRLARLHINRHAFWMGKAWVDGAIENLAGQLNVYYPGEACYESGLTSVDWKNIRQKLGCPDVARRNHAVGRIPTTPLSSSIIGAMQVQEALKLIHNNKRKLFVGKTLYYEGMNNDFIFYENTPPSDDADSSFTYDPIIEVPELSYKSTLRTLLEWAKKHFEEENPVLSLEHQVVLEFVASQKDDIKIKTAVAFQHFSDDITNQYLTEPNERIFITRQQNEFDLLFDQLELTLKEIGVPALDVLKIFANDEIHFVELTGDIDFLPFE